MTLLASTPAAAAILQVPDSLRTAIKDAAIQYDARKTPVSMFLIKKTNSIKEENQYQLGSVEVSGEVANEFRDIMHGLLTEMDSQQYWEERKFVDFYDLRIEYGNIAELNSADVHFFKHIRKQMKGHLELDQITDLSDVKHFESFALESHLESGKIIYFSRVPHARLVTRKRGLTLLFSRGRFNKIKGDVLAIDKNVDCLHFERTGTIVVFNKYNTELIFNFREYYERISKKVFKSLNEDQQLIDADPQVVAAALVKTKILKKITRLEKSSKFNKDINYFIQMKTYLTDNPMKYNPDRVQLEFRDNKVLIDNMARFDTFLRICKGEFAEEVITRKLILATDSEDPLAKES